MFVLYYSKKLLSLDDKQVDMILCVTMIFIRKIKHYKINISRILMVTSMDNRGKK